MTVTTTSAIDPVSIGSVAKAPQPSYAAAAAVLRFEL
jgi:hypothetical protein